eukprot:TRINITY_DN8805_c0_g7_i1.p1 TRINITY_DN8805_c0_g7~~TRINITY_DN8805_c0_g7_i1.p1  ORF type:complete len:676 (+),score=104.38 TRINITY_DN8805_c0_g7_i1:56-2083(+)
MPFRAMASDSAPQEQQASEAVCPSAPPRAEVQVGGAEMEMEQPATGCVGGFLQEVEANSSLPPSDDAMPTKAGMESLGSCAWRGFEESRALSLDVEVAQYDSGFIRSSTAEENLLADNLHSRPRKVIRQVTRSHCYDFVSGLIVLLDFVAICRDADTKARGSGDADIFATVTMQFSFVFYVVDLSLRIFANGLSVLKKSAYVLDAFVIGVSIAEPLVELLYQTERGSSLLMIRMVRLCRLVRLVRVMKFFAGMKELRRLTQMIATCARTMFWSFLMCFLVMSMWAVLAVELAHPVAQELAEQGIWGDCERCGRAFGSVMAANLTFFQTISAGDGWGLLAVPIIERAPSTAFVFCGAVMTLTYGIMQLITAVVVDSFADLRKLDVYSLASEINAEEREEKEFLCKVFGKIDTDGSGQVTFAELCHEAYHVKDFQDWLRVMDIDAGDLARLFRMIDRDENGEIDLDEFIDALYRLKNAESNTTTKLVKHIVDNLEKAADQLSAKVGSLKERLDDMQDMQHPRRHAKTGDPVHLQQGSTMCESDAAVQRACIVALEAALSTARDKIDRLPREASPLAEQPDMASMVATSCETVAAEVLDSKGGQKCNDHSLSSLPLGQSETISKNGIGDRDHPGFSTAESTYPRRVHAAPDGSCEDSGEQAASRNWATCLLLQTKPET